MNNIDEIKARIDIVDLISESVKLRRSGRNYSGFCPFHDNKRTPAFAVFPESGTWRCFGQCNEGGDVFKFLMKKEGWDFPEALRYLADRAGVQLRTLTPQEAEVKDTHERLRELLEDAVTFYRHKLTQTDMGKKAQEYLKNRGLTDEVIETWGLGYGPKSWEEGLTHFRSRGFSDQDLIAAGLVSERDSGGIYDRFRHRIMFPIRDERGRMVGFGARILDPEDIPKFLNSPQTPLFDKSRLLYGLDQAKRSIRSEDQVVIVEGYLDVIALHQHGFSNAVSPMGTALTEHQLRLVKRRTRRIVLALDADAAGDRATLRGLQLARETMDRETELRFDARGLLRQEARLNADIRVVSLPEGLDPDDVVNKNPEDWQKILSNARPVVTHVMETLAAGQNIDDPKVKTQIADQVLPLIEDLSNPIERDTYRQQLARLLRVDERALVGQPPRAPKRSKRPVRKKPEPRVVADPGDETQTKSGAPGFGTGRTLEIFCLGALMRNPGLTYKIDRALQRNNLNRITGRDFQSSDHQAFMRLIIQAVDQDYDQPLQVVLASLPLSMMDLADDILRQTENLESNERRLLEDLLRAILDMRRRNINQNINHLRFLMQEAQEGGDLIVKDYQQSMGQHTTTLARLDQALRDTNERTILSG